MKSAEESITVPRDHNRIVARFEGQSWVSISSSDGELVRRRTGNPLLNFSVAPGSYVVRSDGAIKELSSKHAELPQSRFDQGQQEQPARLHLTSDAPDRHVVDGIGEMPADGSSFCTISVQKTDSAGLPLTATEDADELFLRTTGGTIMDAVGERRIRSLSLESGSVSFRLVSEPQPRFVTLSVFGRDRRLSAEIQIEFVWVE